jgi:putative oxidoreductase
VDDLDAINLALLMLRVVVGVVMFAHGYNHLLRIREGPGVANWFESLGMKYAPLQAWNVTVFEIVGGVMLVLGIITPLAAASAAAICLVAWTAEHRKHGFFIFKPGQGWEYVMVLAVVSIAIGALGAGEWSLDEAFGILDDMSGTTGLLIAVIAGIGGAALQLALFWRPPPSSDA